MKKILLGITLITVISCSESQTQESNSESEYLAQNDKPTELPMNDLMQIFRNKLSSDEMPNLPMAKRTNKVNSIKKFLVSRNSENLNYLIEYVEFNESGDTIIHSSTEEREMNWKDENHFVYNSDGTLREKNVLNCVYPLEGNPPILLSPDKFKSQNQSNFKYFFSDGRPNKIEYYSSKGHLVNTRFYNYEDSLLVSFWKVYPDDSDTTRINFYYNDEGYLKEKNENFGGMSVSKTYGYDNQNRLSIVKTDHTDVQIEYYPDSISIIKNIHDTQYRTLILIEKDLVVEKQETLLGSRFYSEKFSYDDLGRLVSTEISSPYTEEKSLKYRIEYN